MLNRKRTSENLSLTLAFLAFISLGLPDGLLGVAWPSISRSMKVPIDALGLLLACTTLGYLGSSFAAGKLLARMSVGALLALSTLFAATALLGFATLQVWGLLLVCALLAGLGGGAIDAALNTYGAHYFSARSLNWLHAFFGVGTTIGPLIMTNVLGAQASWRWGYAIVGTVQLLLALGFLLTRHTWLELTPPDPDGANLSPSRSRDALKNSKVLLGMVWFFVYSGTEMTVASWSFTLLTLSRGVNQESAGYWVAFFWGSLMMGRVLFGFVANRVNLPTTLRLCIVGILMGSVLIAQHQIPALSYLGLLVSGLAMAPLFASLIKLTPARVGKQFAQNAIGFQIAAAGLGGAALPALTGVLSRGLGLEFIGLMVVIEALVLYLLYEALSRSAKTAAPRQPHAP